MALSFKKFQYEIFMFRFFINPNLNFDSSSKGTEIKCCQPFFLELGAPVKNDRSSLTLKGT